MNKHFNRFIGVAPNEATATLVPKLLRKQQDEQREAGRKNQRRRNVSASKVGERLLIAVRYMAFSKGYKQRHTR